MATLLNEKKKKKSLFHFSCSFSVLIFLRVVGVKDILKLIFFPFPVYSVDRFQCFGFVQFQDTLLNILKESFCRCPFLTDSFGMHFLDLTIELEEAICWCSLKNSVCKIQNTRKYSEVISVISSRKQKRLKGTHTKISSKITATHNTKRQCYIGQGIQE